MQRPASRVLSIKKQPHMFSLLLLLGFVIWEMMKQPAFGPHWFLDEGAVGAAVSKLFTRDKSVSRHLNSLVISDLPDLLKASQSIALRCLEDLAQLKLNWAAEQHIKAPPSVSRPDVPWSFLNSHPGAWHGAVSKHVDRAGWAAWKLEKEACIYEVVWGAVLRQA